MNYFSSYLTKFLGCSKKTIESYRDTFVLFFDYLATHERITSDNIKLEDFNEAIVERFLNYLEENRGNSINTRNQRLGCLKSFANYLKRKEFAFLSQWERITDIPSKKKITQQIAYLTIKELKILLSMPDNTTKKGRREKALLSFMYDTGCRVQEIIETQICNIRFSSPPSVEVLGKGAKYRQIPFSLEVRDLLREYLKDQNLNISSEQYVFRNNVNKKLTRAGVQYILDKNIQKARQENPHLFLKKISNHSLRHSKAMHLLEAGVNLIYIRDLLGHASVNTTEIYARVNPEIKRRILEKNYSEVHSDTKYTDEKKSELVEWLKTSL
ncbi:tyrosine-type recombinase/integrase [Enterococcus pallens]|nr:tyrosine-type recombinase/integrase [Enterococcus pallens]